MCKGVVNNGVLRTGAWALSMEARAVEDATSSGLLEWQALDTPVDRSLGAEASVGVMVPGHRPAVPGV